MDLDRAQELLELAAGPARERISADREGAPHHLDAFLKEVDRHLFSPDLKVTELLRRLRIAPSAAFQLFNEKMDLTPAAYVEEARLETAARLLALEEAMPLEMLAGLVGYLSIEGFRRALRRWCSCSPGALRRQLREVMERSAEPLDWAWLRRRGLRRLAARDLKASEAANLRQWLKVSYGLSSGEEMDSPALNRLEFERRWAAEWWSLVRDLPPAERRQRVISGLRFETPALFEYLCTMSREEGRDDRRKSVEVAGLALQCLASLEGIVSEQELGRLRGRGWAYLGNARRQALEYSSAEDAFEIAQALFDASDTPCQRAAFLAASCADWPSAILRAVVAYGSRGKLASRPPPPSFHRSHSPGGGDYSLNRNLRRIGNLCKRDRALTARREARRGRALGR